MLENSAVGVTYYTNQTLLSAHVYEMIRNVCHRKVETCLSVEFLDASLPVLFIDPR